LTRLKSLGYNITTDSSPPSQLFEDASAWAIWDLPNIPKYNRGAVCIMGDAAHAPSPFQGQGAGQAIEDSLTLTDLFAHVKTVEDVSLALAAFDQVRRPRAGKNVVESRRTGRIFSMMDEEWTDVRGIAEGFPGRMGWVWGRDMVEQSADAVRVFEGLKGENRAVF
jgi:salicylate hydroxylase